MAPTPAPDATTRGTLGDLLSHYCTEVPSTDIVQFEMKHLVTLLARRLGQTEDPFAVPLRPAQELMNTFEAHIAEPSTQKKWSTNTIAIRRSRMRDLLEVAHRVVEEQGGRDLTDLPPLPLPAQPAVKHRAETLGQLQELYLASGACPLSVQPNIPGVFRRCAELVGGTADPWAVSLSDAKGLLNRFRQDLWKRHARGELRADSVPRYISWLRQALLWACDNLLRWEIHTPLEVLLQLDSDQHQQLDWLKQHRPKVERQMVAKFFLWLEGESLTLDALATDGLDLTRRFAHEQLEPRGQLSWRTRYTAACRGLRHLQEASLLPAFPIYQLKNTLASYAIPWQEIPQPELLLLAQTYARVACDEEAFDQRSGRVIKPQTRDTRLRVLGQYTGFLSQVQGLDLATMTLEQIFSRENLLAFVAFLKERQQAQVTGGTEGTLNHLRQLVCGAFGVPKDLFKNLIDPKKVVRGTKAGRVPSLDDFHHFLDLLQNAAQQPENRRTGQQIGATGRLHAMLTVLNDFPMPIHALCTLRLGQHLLQDARTRKWTLHFDADELNGNHPFDYPLAEETGIVLDHYLNDMRPQLLPQGESPYLFPGADGKPVLQATLSQQLTRWDTRLRGVEPHQALTPSLIRDMVEHTCLLFLPGNGPLVAATLLQVSRIKTRDQHLLDEVGRAAIQRDDRMERWANQEDLGPEEIRKLLNELKTNPNDWRRFVKAVHDLKASA